jgi:VWFA-related protein
MIMFDKSRSLRFLLCLFSAALGFNIFSAAAPVVQSDSSFRLRVDVDLATIEVSVSDKEGKPVPNLAKEDFELYEDGKKQEILSIDEVNSRISSLGASPIEEKNVRHGKIVLIVFDENTIPKVYSQKSRASAAAFVKKHMGPQDYFAVAEWGASMKILQNLTDDREDVLAAIAGTAPYYSTGSSFDDMLQALETVNRSMAPIEGRKSVLIYGQCLSYTTNHTDIYDKTIESARRSNVAYYFIDTGEMASAAQGAGIPFPLRIGLGSNRGAESLVPAGVSHSLATESGGFPITAQNIDAELDKLDQRLSNYYILGFQSNNPDHNGAFRNVKVKAKSKGVTLNYRPGYQDRSPVDTLASSRQERSLIAALANPGSVAQLPVTFRPMYFYLSPQRVRVLVAAKIRMEKVGFRKKGAQIATDLNIMGAAYAEDGSIAARFSQTLPLSFDKEQEPEFRKEGLTYRNYFKLRPGKYHLKLAVSDESNNLGAAEQFLEVPAFPDHGLAGSSIVIAEQTSRPPDLIRNLQTQLLDESDPLLCAGVQIEPNAENMLRAGSSIPIMFRLYNLHGSPDQSDLGVKITLIDETGKEHALGPISLDKAIHPVSETEAAIELRLQFPNVPPGKYRLVIEAGKPASSETAMLQTEVTFTK